MTRTEAVAITRAVEDLIGVLLAPNIDGPHPDDLHEVRRNLVALLEPIEIPRYA